MLLLHYAPTFQSFGHIISQNCPCFEVSLHCRNILTSTGAIWAARKRIVFPLFSSIDCSTPCNLPVEMGRKPPFSFYKTIWKQWERDAALTLDKRQTVPEHLRGFPETPEAFRMASCFPYHHASYYRSEVVSICRSFRHRCEDSCRNTCQKARKTTTIEKISYLVAYDC